ncbi:MAG: LysM peptidoglycan-binding domain-containing protein [Anaerolineae bacterium]|nr:LysM peptidoglycan-binding domain-containing protein [Anaerolineae bacterium]
MEVIKRAIAERYRWLAGVILIISLVSAFSPAVSAQGSGGYWYTVRRGDSWASIAARTGISVAELQRANPKAIHRYHWLYQGERIWIPQRGSGAGYWYVVRSGDSWTSISQRTGISVWKLQRANPKAIHRFHWLYAGERIWIPSSKPVQTPTPTPPSFACPEHLSDYGDAMKALLTDTNGDVRALTAWLTGCGVLAKDRGVVRSVDITGDGKKEVVVALGASGTGMPAPPGDLWVLRPSGWTVDFQANAAGQVKVLDVGDVNQDGHMDVVWLETTCGAHTCFGSVYVISWTGQEFESWVDGTLTMAYPEVRLQDVSDKGTGREIIVHGGVIGSVGAGPQRAWTEVWASPGGAPYVRISKVYDPSDCLYHTVLDANQAFLNGRADGFAKAVTLYRKAVEDPTLIACWVRPNELEELRTFSAFRLAMAYAYQGDMANAEATISYLKSTYPGTVYAQIADVWWTAYQPARDMNAACAAVNAFVAGPPAHPEAYEMLADYGYANPSFSASDVCPVIP